MTAPFRRSALVVVALLALSSAASCRRHRFHRTHRAVVSASAKPSTSASTTTAAAAHPQFHRVSSATGTVYLLGSIHVGRAALYPLPRAIEQAFEQSDALVVEVKLDLAAKVKAMKVLSDARYTPPDGLHAHVDEKTWTLLKKDPPLPIGVLDRMHPWTVAITVLAADLQKNGFDPDAGIDRHFMDEADAVAKPIEGLETVEEQLSLLSSLPDDLQAAMLKESLEEGATIGDEIGAMADAWAKGDEAALTKTVRANWNDPQYATLYRRMFTDRNVKMADAVERFLGDKKTRFMVVGAGHVVGDGGIVDLLRKRGHSVRGVPPL